MPAMPLQPAPPSPDLHDLRRWLQDACEDGVALFGPVDQPDAVGVWYPTHLQIARLRPSYGLPLVVLQTTFCALPRRRSDVLPLLAQANQQLERGRWYLQKDPARLTCALELPAPLLDGERFHREWRRFYDEAVSHGIELTLRSRGVAYVDLLRAQARDRQAN
jgi:hypothetical protein